MLILEIVLGLAVVFAVSWVLVLIAQNLVRPLFLHAAIYMPKRRASAVLDAGSFFLYTFAGTLITAALITVSVNAAVVVNQVV